MSGVETERRMGLWDRALILREHAIRSSLRDRLASAARMVWLVFRGLACGLLVFQLIVFAILQFDAALAAREWGRFLTHYASATSQARLPVEVFLVVVIGWLSVMSGLGDRADFISCAKRFQGGDHGKAR